MEIEAYLTEIKEIHTTLLNFIESTDDFDAQFKALIEILEKRDIVHKKEEVDLFCKLISKIADNHHRTSDFFTKLEKIFRYIIEDTPTPISNLIPDYKNYNKQVLFFLFKDKILEPDESFLNTFLQNKPNQATFSKENHNEFQSYYYLYPVIKKFIDNEIQKQIEEEIFKKFDVDLSEFEKKVPNW